MPPLVKYTEFKYTDRSKEPCVLSPNDDDSDINNPKFPVLLHEIVSRAETMGFSHICSWKSHGRAFQIYDKNAFIKIVAPPFFRHSSFNSFQRQLNIYCFKRISNKGRDPGSYFHEYFLRGRPDLCNQIVRPRSDDPMMRMMPSDPDFHSMEPVGNSKESIIAGRANTHDTAALYKGAPLPERGVQLDAFPCGGQVETNQMGQKKVAVGSWSPSGRSADSGSSPNNNYSRKRSSNQEDLPSNLLTLSTDVCAIQSNDFDQSLPRKRPFRVNSPTSPSNAMFESTARSPIKTPSIYASETKLSYRSPQNKFDMNALLVSNKFGPRKLKAESTNRFPKKSERKHSNHDSKLKRLSPVMAQSPVNFALLVTEQSSLLSRSFRCLDVDRRVSETKKSPSPRESLMGLPCTNQGPLLKGQLFSLLQNMKDPHDSKNMKRGKSTSADLHSIFQANYAHDVGSEDYSFRATCQQPTRMEVPTVPEDQKPMATGPQSSPHQVYKGSCCSDIMEEGNKSEVKETLNLHSFRSENMQKIEVSELEELTSMVSFLEGKLHSFRSEIKEEIDNYELDELSSMASFLDDVDLD